MTTVGHAMLCCRACVDDVAWSDRVWSQCVFSALVSQ